MPRKINTPKSKEEPGKQAHAVFKYLVPHQKARGELMDECREDLARRTERTRCRALSV